MGRLAATWERVPFLRALVFLCLGIVFARSREVPLWLAGGGLVVCGAMAFFAQSGLYAAAAIFCFGVVASELHAPGTGVPFSRTVLVQLRVEEPPVPRGRYATADGWVEAWRSEQGRWHAVREGVLLRCDSAADFRTGERLLCRGRVKPFPNSSYGRLMRARGYAGTFRLQEHALLERDTQCRRAGLLRRLHEGAAERMMRLPMRRDNRAVAAAMAAGHRRELTPELRRTYARTGTSHLLAVSGLHVGVVFLGANLLLWWLPLFRYGHRWRNAAVMALVWLYAAATGLPASVVRAAVMFSFLQLSLFSTAEYSGMNALCAAAFVMLVVDARWIADISFQLSFAAVAGIVAWCVPIHRRLSTGNRPADFLTGLVVAGAAASLATAPLVAYAFGTVAPAGVVLNPVVVLLAEATVAVAALWMVFPVAGAAPLFGRVLDWTAGAQNDLARWAAGWPSAAFDVTLDGPQTAACYLFFAAVTLMVWSTEPKKRVSLPR